MSMETCDSHDVAWDDRSRYECPACEIESNFKEWIKYAKDLSKELAARGIETELEEPEDRFYLAEDDRYSNDFNRDENAG